MSKSRYIAWIMWLAASSFYAYQYIIRVLPNVLMTPIMERFAIDAEGFADFSGIYYVGYVVMHIPFGILLDRVGPRIVMPISILLVCLGLLPVIYGESWNFVLFSRFVVGMGSSAAILSVFKVIRMGFAQEEFSKMLGLAATIGLACAILGGRPLSATMESIGWIQTVEMLALIGVVIAILTFFIVPKYESNVKHDGVFSDIARVLLNTKVISICLIGGLMVSPMEGFADAWGTNFFKVFHGIDKNVAEFLPSLIFLGFAIGSCLLGFVVERFKQYYVLLAICGITLFISFLPIIAYPGMSVLLIKFLLLIAGIASAYQIFIIYLATTYVPESLSGITSSIANMIIMAFGTFFHKIMGAVLNYGANPSLESSAIKYTAEAYRNVVFVVPFFIFIALMLLFMHCKFLSKKSKKT